jgi:arabinose-5-phosphate isomerase
VQAQMSASKQLALWLKARSSFQKSQDIYQVFRDAGKLVGVITDGDLRRMLEKNAELNGVLARDIMTPNPKTIAATEMAINALDMMRQHEIMQLVVTEGDTYAGIIHLHDLVKEGLI